MIIDIVKVFLPAVGAFILGILVTPILTSYLYSHQMWKSKAAKSLWMDAKPKYSTNFTKKKKLTLRAWAA